MKKVLELDPTTGFPRQTAEEILELDDISQTPVANGIPQADDSNKIANGWLHLPLPGYIEVKEVDGSPDLTQVTTLVFANGDVTYEGSGVVRVRSASDASGTGGVTIQEADGTPSVTLATTLKVGNGDLVDEGGGIVRIKTASDVVSGGGGGGDNSLFLWQNFH